MDEVGDTPRFVHSEGHVDLCFDGQGDHIFTCGQDGDVRVLSGFDDEDPDSYRAGDHLTAIAFSKGKFYVASSENAVKIYTFPEGDADGILTRFTNSISHMCFTPSGKQLIAGASDFTVKIVDVASSQQKQLMEYEAPVLSVACHPSEKLVASSSCDGTAKIYNLTENNVIKTITGLPKSNGFSQSHTLSRMSFDKQGKVMAIPIEKEVKLYNTENWEVLATLADDSIQEYVSITSFSPCGKYVVATCRDGKMLVFDKATKKCVTRSQHEKKLTITALAWNPKANNELLYTDNNGYLSIWRNVIPSSNEKESSEQLNEDQLADLFDDDDDMEPQDINELLDAEAEKADEDDEDEVTQSERRSRVTRIEDDDSNMSNAVDIGALKKSLLGDIGDIDDEDKASVKSAPSVAPAPAAPRAPGFQPTPLQEAFQPGSSPTYLSHRYMMWNSVGVIVQYNTDEENSITIEFHDTATHHAMHVTNTRAHTMADVNSDAVVLACEADSTDGDADSSSESQLVCMHFSSWDNCKEWSVPMPEGESVEAVCLGDGWIAAATSRRLVRVFTVGGVQREVFSVGGPVVALSGHTHQLMVVYHSGMGIPGDQCLGVRLVNVTGKKKTVIADDRLPLSAKSVLTWMGFSAEGTPLYVDSAGVVRMLSRKFGNNWTQVCNLKKYAKGKSDTFFIVSVHENPQQIRAVMCKGSKFPQTVPRPNVQILPFEIPLCETSTDKGTIEADLYRSYLFNEHLDWWKTQGFDFDESSLSQATMQQQESLMKLFALACKSEREFRAMELCEMMPTSHMVQLAIKYASRLRLINLAQRLSELAKQKADEEFMKAGVEEEEDDDEEEMPVLQSKPSTSKVKQIEKQESVDVEEEEDVDEEMEDEPKPAAPQIKFGSKKEKDTTPKTLPNSQKKNPFKMSQKITPSSGSGTKVFDSIEMRKSSSAKDTASPLNKPLPKLKIGPKKMSGQSNLLSFKKDSTPKSMPKSVAQDENKPKSESNENDKSSKSDFQQWFDDVKGDLQEEYPELSDSDLVVKAARLYRDVLKEKQNEDTESTKKRKRDEDDNSQSSKKSPAVKTNSQMSEKTSSKLASFSFSKQ